MSPKASVIIALFVIIWPIFCLPSGADEIAGSVGEDRYASKDRSVGEDRYVRKDGYAGEVDYASKDHLPGEDRYVHEDGCAIQRINELTNDIIAREIELQKLNTVFRIESARQPKLRPWRQFAYSEVNANGTLAGLIGRMALSYPYMQEDSGRPDQGAVQRCAVSSMVGQLFAAGGESCEVLLNLKNDWKARKKGWDPKTYRKKVVALTTELDALIAERDALIGGTAFGAGELKVLNAETALLKDVRDLALVQYGQYHSSAKKLRFFQNAAYLISISRNLVGATSNILNIQASRLRDNNIAGHASLLNVVAGALVVATPIFGRVSGNLAGLVDRRLVSKDYADAQAKETSRFVQDRLKLDEVLREESGTLSWRHDQMKRAKIYSRQEELLVAQEANIKRERKQAKNTTIENVAFGTIVGSSRITAGILGMVGAWKYDDRPWMSSRMTAAGSTVYGAGTALNALETARIRFSQEWRNRQDAKKGILPRQVLQQRLAALDAMSQALHSEGMAAQKSGNLLQ